MVDENIQGEVNLWGKLHDFKEIYWGEGACKQPPIIEGKKGLKVIN